MNWLVFILVCLVLCIFLFGSELAKQKAVIEQQRQEIDDLCDALMDKTLPCRPWLESEEEAVEGIVKDWNAYGYGDYRRLVIAGMLYKEETLRKGAVKGHFLEDDIIAPPSIQIEDWCDHKPGDEVEIVFLNNIKKHNNG